MYGKVYSLEPVREYQAPQISLTFESNIIYLESQHLCKQAEEMISPKVKLNEHQLYEFIRHLNGSPNYKSFLVHTFFGEFLISDLEMKMLWQFAQTNEFMAHYKQNQRGYGSINLYTTPALALPKQELADEVNINISVYSKGKFKEIILYVDKAFKIFNLDEWNRFTRFMRSIDSVEDYMFNGKFFIIDDPFSVKDDYPLKDKLDINLQQAEELFLFAENNGLSYRFNAEPLLDKILAEDGKIYEVKSEYWTVSHH